MSCYLAIQLLQVFHLTDVTQLHFKLKKYRISVSLENIKALIDCAPLKSNCQSMHLDTVPKHILSCFNFLEK